MTGTAHVIQADARSLPLADASVDLIVTSPPYFALRSYQDGGEHYSGQLGSEATPAEFVDALLECMREMVRVTKPSGSIFVNLGDKFSGRSGGPQGKTGGRADRTQAQTYALRRPDAPAGIPEKSLCLLPERFRIRCVDDLGLICRSVIVWQKPNGLPESVTDRVRRSHEDWMHFTVQPRYFSAVDEIREPHAFPNHGQIGKNARGTKWDAHPLDDADSYGARWNVQERQLNPLGKLPGSVWTIPTEPLQVPDHLGVDHFAAFPTEWPRRIIQGWSPSGVCEVCGFLLGSSYDNGLLGVRTADNRRPHQDRARAQARAEAQSVLREVVLEPLERSQSGLDEIPPPDDPRLHRSLEPGTPDGAEERLPDGAQAHHGRAPGTDAGLVRGRPSHQRGQDGQPDRESRTDGQGRARSAAQTRAAAIPVPALRRSRADQVNAEHACPNCGCDSLRPSLILDPFGGTGTSSLVAKALGRHGISIDMSADYTRLAEWRVNDPDQLAKAARVQKPPKQVDGQIGFDLEWDDAS